MMKRVPFLTFVIYSLVFWFALAQAGTIELPETGQTTCYDAAGNVISCAGTGQDGEHKADVAVCFI